MTIIFVISLSIVGQLLLAATYVKELTENQLSYPSRIKSVLAAITFTGFAFFLGWSLVTHSLKPAPASISSVSAPAGNITLARK